MVNTKNTEPRVLDETLRSSILEDKPTTFAIGELTRLGNGEGTSNRGGGYGRLTKLDILKLNGEDVIGWLFRVKQFFLIDNVHEDQKTRLVSMHLYDKALEWHTQFLKIHGENVLWPDYEKEILARFSSVFEDPMVELKNLKQDGKVKVYQEKLEVLLNRLDLTESYANTGGHIKIKHVSQYVGYVGSRTNSHACDDRYVSFATPVNKLILSLPSSATKTVGKVVKSGFRKQLTQKELEERRAKGLCFYCDQRYAPGHKCPGHLYSLEVCVDEIDEVKEVCDDMEIREDNQTTRYTETKKLPCHLTPTTPLRVDVANGSRIGKKIMLRGSQSGSLQWIQGKQDITEGQWIQAQLASMILQKGSENKLSWLL
uniref:Retrotransposon gag domain-containing protein n=1 Tax=Tanacetum cinerariifolium TaxID=118510 RepID=A0A699ICB7_TANCI|nr:hypothetical protein [Tanacetum cinerariifolium]